MNVTAQQKGRSDNQIKKVCTTLTVDGTLRGNGGGAVGSGVTVKVFEKENGSWNYKAESQTNSNGYYYISFTGTWNSDHKVEGYCCNLEYGTTGIQQYSYVDQYTCDARVNFSCAGDCNP
ncbi:MAG: hypothetical protein AAB071_00350 [Bacteroidota bacterium]